MYAYFWFYVRPLHSSAVLKYCAVKKPKHFKFMMICVNKTKQTLTTSLPEMAEVKLVKFLNVFL